MLVEVLFENRIGHLFRIKPPIHSPFPTSPPPPHTKETETSMLSEVATLRNLLTALSEATRSPNQLLENAESFLASTGGAITSSATHHAHPEVFASAVDAILSIKQQQQRNLLAASTSVSETSESVISSSVTTSSSSTGAGFDGACGGSPISSQISFHSTGSCTTNGVPPGPHHQMAAILRQPRPQVSYESRVFVDGSWEYHFLVEREQTKYKHFVLNSISVNKKRFLLHKRFS